MKDALRSASGRVSSLYTAVNVNEERVCTGQKRPEYDCLVLMDCHYVSWKDSEIYICHP